jgi:hypothetical protein
MQVCCYLKKEKKGPLTKVGKWSVSLLDGILSSPTIFGCKGDRCPVGTIGGGGRPKLWCRQCFLRAN